MTFTIDTDHLENDEVQITEDSNGDLVVKHVPSGRTLKLDDSVSVSDLLSSIDGKAADPHGAAAHASEVVHDGEDTSLGALITESLSTDDAQIGTLNQELITVGPGGAYPDLSSAYADITDAAPDNRYLLWLTGPITETSLPLQPKDHIDIKGSSRAVVTCDNGTTGDSKIHGIEFRGLTDVTVQDLYVDRTGDGSDRNFAVRIFNCGDDVEFDNLNAINTMTVTGSRNMGISVEGGSTCRLLNCYAEGNPDSSNLHTGLRAGMDGSTPVIKNSIGVARGDLGRGLGSIHNAEVKWDGCTGLGGQRGINIVNDEGTGAIFTACVALTLKTTGIRQDAIYVNGGATPTLNGCYGEGHEGAGIRLHDDSRNFVEVNGGVFIGEVDDVYTYGGLVSGGGGVLRATGATFKSPDARAMNCYSASTAAIQLTDCSIISGGDATAGHDRALNFAAGSNSPSYVHGGSIRHRGNGDALSYPSATDADGLEVRGTVIEAEGAGTAVVVDGTTTRPDIQAESITGGFNSAIPYPYNGAFDLGSYSGLFHGEIAENDGTTGSAGFYLWNGTDWVKLDDSTTTITP